jgi:EpsI family protein
VELTVPDVVGPWRRSAADGILIPRGERPEDRTYDDVVTAYYTSPSAPSVMLLIAYGSAQTGSTQLHRPEVCYPAAGFHVRGSHEQALTLGTKSIAARTMTATATGRTEQILYWSRVGNDFPTSPMDQRWSVLRYALHGVTADGALVRMSVMDDDAAAALPYLRAFASALVATSGSEMRRLLIGAA